MKSKRFKQSEVDEVADGFSIIYMYNKDAPMHLGQEVFKRKIVLPRVIETSGLTSGRNSLGVVNNSSDLKKKSKLLLFILLLYLNSKTKIHEF